MSPEERAENDRGLANINGRLKALYMQRERAETGEMNALARVEELTVELAAARQEIEALKKAHPKKSALRGK